MSARSKMDEYNNYVDSRRPLRKSEERGDRLSCGGRCARKALLSVNVFFLILGVTLIGLGVYVRNSDTVKLNSDALPTAAVALGSVLSVISFFGCCGAWARSRGCLSLFMLVVLLAVVAQMVVAGLILRDHSTAKTWLRKGWKSLDDNERLDFQDRLDCCGLDEFNDEYAALPCPEEATEPCLGKLEEEVKDKLVLLGAIGIVFAVLQLLGLLLACCLRRSLKRQEFEDEEEEALDDARRVNRRYQ